VRRVVITGMGAVSAAGLGAQTLWQSCVSGTSGVREILFPEIPNQKVKFGAALRSEDLAQIIQPKEARFQDRIAIISRNAGHEAVAQAGWKDAAFDENCGVIFGSGFGGAQTLDNNYMTFGRDPTLRLDPISIPKIMSNASAAWLAMEFGITGPTYCISTACSSAGQSIGLAKQMIQSGVIDRCLAGGAEACLVPGTFRAWELMRVMSPDLCRPFSKNRNGMVLGEGAGVLTLETLDSAQERGAPILAELSGYGSSSDAGDLLRPDIDGAARAMDQAIRDSGLAVEQIGYINAHGTGTIANDENEAKAIQKVLGSAAEKCAVSSTKPIHGHALGAAGALELITTVFALNNQTAPPTINFDELDPKVGFDPVANTSLPIDTVACMSNSFAFGGINATLLVSKPQ
jgi:3-oxoacyl-(acyl-carrier-protein) synthase